jgi:hypothetical protein
VDRSDPDYIEELMLMLQADGDQRAFEQRTGPGALTA